MLPESAVYKGTFQKIVDLLAFNHIVFKHNGSPAFSIILPE